MATERTSMNIRTIVPMGVMSLALTAGCGTTGSTSSIAPAPAAAPPSAAVKPPASANASTGGGEVTALGDRKAPLSSTTAASVVAAAKAAGVDVKGTAKEDAALCAKYQGCKSAASAGSVKAVVFESTAVAQAYRDTPDGAVVEEQGGRRYWSLVDYRELKPEDRSAWREVQRAIIP